MGTTKKSGRVLRMKTAPVIAGGARSHGEAAAVAKIVVKRAAALERLVRAEVGKAQTNPRQGVSRWSCSINKRTILLPIFVRQLVFGCPNRENEVFIRARRGKMSHNIIYYHWAGRGHSPKQATFGDSRHEPGIRATLTERKRAEPKTRRFDRAGNSENGRFHLRNGSETTSRY